MTAAAGTVPSIGKAGQRGTVTDNNEYVDKADDINTAREGLNITEAADRMGVTLQTIRNWIKAGDLPATHFGPRITRVAHGDLDRLRRTT